MLRVLTKVHFFITFISNIIEGIFVMWVVNQTKEKLKKNKNGRCTFVDLWSLHSTSFSQPIMERREKKKRKEEKEMWGGICPRTVGA